MGRRDGMLTPRVPTRTSRPPPRTLYALQKHGPRDPPIPQTLRARDPTHTNSTTLAAARTPESATPHTHDTTKMRNTSTPHGRTSSNPNKTGRENGAGQTLGGPRTTTRGTHTHPYSRDRGTRVGPQKTRTGSMQRDNRPPKTRNRTSTHQGRTWPTAKSTEKGTPN